RRCEGVNEMYTLAIFSLSRALVCTSARRADAASGAKSPAPANGGGKSAPAPVRTDVHLYPVLVDGKWGYIERDGKMAIKPQCTGGARFSHGMAAVQTQLAGKVGFIDETGKIVIPQQFKLADPFSEGYAAVLTFTDLKWGYID